MREQSMRAGISFRFDRSPNFFSLHAAHSPDNVTWIITAGSKVVASTSVVVRRAYVDQAVHTIAYLADLRQAGGKRVAGAWRKAALFVLREAQREYGATLTYCSILRDNRIARSSILASRLGRRLGFRRLRGYKTVTLVGRLPWRRRSNSGLTVRCASTSDSDSLRQFVDRQSKDLQLSPVFENETWRHRLERWPQFGIENFLVAYDTEQRVVGCLAVWDSSAINRIVVDHLPPPAELLRRVANAGAMFTGRPRIPVGPDSCMPDVALTHIRIADRDPRVFAALIDAAYTQQIKARRCATLSLCLYDDDPLWAGLRHTIHSTIPMDVYWAPLTAGTDGASIERNDLWPGFEPYLV